MLEAEVIVLVIALALVVAAGVCVAFIMLALTIQSLIGIWRQIKKGGE